jgi:hypothetical protein
MNLVEKKMLKQIVENNKNVIFLFHAVSAHLVIGLLFGAKYREQLDIFLDSELFKLINLIHYLRNFI